VLGGDPDLSRWRGVHEGGRLSQAVERLIDNYAERCDFDRLATFDAKQLEISEQLQNGTWDKENLVSDQDPCALNGRNHA
jgi:hypothetical protein